MNINLRPLDMCNTECRHLTLGPEEEAHRLNDSPSGQPGYCIDEYCTCGLHHCPQQATPQVAFSGNSTFREEYKCYDLESYRQQGKLDLGLGYDTDQALAGVHGPERPNIPFTGVSSLRSNFPGFRPEPPAPGLRFDPSARSAPDDRTFTSAFRKNFPPNIPHPCPAARLPPPPTDSSHKHAFFDSVTKTYY